MKYAQECEARELNQIDNRVAGDKNLLQSGLSEDNGTLEKTARRGFDAS
jgi:hypothetical protein